MAAVFHARPYHACKILSSLGTHKEGCCKMSIRGDGPSCPNSQSLVVLGVLPSCLADEADPDLLEFLADCACGGAGGGGGVLGDDAGFLVRAMSCGDAAELMGQVRHGRR